MLYLQAWRLKGLLCVAIEYSAPVMMPTGLSSWPEWQGLLPARNTLYNKKDCICVRVRRLAMVTNSFGRMTVFDQCLGLVQL
jgi:hypothetical protein